MGSAVGGARFGILRVGEVRVPSRNYIGRGEMLQPGRGAWELVVGGLGVGGPGVEGSGGAVNEVNSLHCGLSRCRRKLIHMASGSGDDDGHAAFWICFNESDRTPMSLLFI